VDPCSAYSRPKEHMQSAAKETLKAHKLQQASREVRFVEEKTTA